MVTQIKPWFFLFVLGLPVVVACSAQRPVLYPNEQLTRTGRVVAEREIDDCLDKAATYVASGGRASEVAGDAASDAGTGAAIGAATGAVGGAVIGHAGRGAAVGGAGGAAAGLTRGAIKSLSGSSAPDPVTRNFVTRCLGEKGYEVIGWR